MKLGVLRHILRFGFDTSFTFKLNQPHYSFKMVNIKKVNLQLSRSAFPTGNDSDFGSQMLSQATLKIFELGGQMRIPGGRS